MGQALAPRFLRRQDDSRCIKALAEAGKSIKQITRSTGRSRKLIRSVFRGGDGDVFRCRQSMLEPNICKLRAEWDAGSRRGAELWLRLCAGGFRGGLRVVAGWTTWQRRSEKADVGLARKVPPARFVESPHGGAAHAAGWDCPAFVDTPRLYPQGVAYAQDPFALCAGIPAPDDRVDPRRT